MKAGRHILNVTQGETIRETISVQAGGVDLITEAGWKARMVGRTRREATSDLFSLDETSGITIDDVNSELEYTVADTVTETWDFETGWYHLEIESPSGDVVPLHEGPIRFFRR